MNRQAVLILPVLLMACSTGSIRGVQTFGNAPSHVSWQVTSPQDPPAGGAHSPVWQTCGMYDENAVHSLEHGAVWILYRQSIAVDQVQQLQQAAAGQPFTLLSPYPDLRSPLVMVACNTQLDLDSTTDPRIERFIQRYAQGNGVHEPGAPWSGGPGRRREDGGQGSARCCGHPARTRVFYTT